MSFNQTPGNGKTETATTGSPGTGLVHPVKSLKDIGQVLSGNTLPGIGHANFNPAILPGGRHRY
jgi:hypothetical protein